MALDLPVLCQLTCSSGKLSIINASKWIHASKWILKAELLDDFFVQKKLQNDTIFVDLIY
jgi:hypothetical protein